jgi:UDP-N-acetylmuramoyl-L-alanyl-D-glutamate--2,6-diaminopimelate ligase
MLRRLALDRTPGWRLLEPSVRVCEAAAARAWTGNPASRLRLIGVTGTNGKTTTCALIGSVLEAAGLRAGISSTTHVGRVDDPPFDPGPLTTPQPWELQRRLRAFVDQGSTWAVVELTSHGLALRRDAGLRLEGAVFTNLTHDHLDWHRSFPRYASAKLRLLRSRPHFVVVNADDPWTRSIEAPPPGRTISFGLAAGGDVSAKRIEPGEDNTRFTLVTDAGEHTVELPLLGRMNVANALAAAAVGVALDLDVAAIADGLQRVPPVPGRLELVDAGQPFAVVVDYAHNPDGLGQAYDTARAITAGRLIGVLGIGGDRDRSKRPVMGRIAAERCDHLVLTDLESRDEDPERIVAGLAEGVEQVAASERASYEVVLDRRAAIARALAVADAGDCVVLTGLGHQRYRSVAGHRVPWSDPAIARELLEARLLNV